MKRLPGFLLTLSTEVIRQKKAPVKAREKALEKKVESLHVPPRVSFKATDPTQKLHFL